MRLYTVTIAVRLGDDDKPKVAVDLDVEDGVPADVLDTIGSMVQSVGKSITAQIAAGDYDASVRA